MAEPSKVWPCSKASSSSAGVIANDLRKPSTSVNQSRMKRMSRSSTIRRTYSRCLSMFRQAPRLGSGGHATCARFMKQRRRARPALLSWRRGALAPGRGTDRSGGRGRRRQRRADPVLLPGGLGAGRAPGGLPRAGGDRLPARGPGVQAQLPGGQPGRGGARRRPHRSRRGRGRVRRLHPRRPGQRRRAVPRGTGAGRLPQGAAPQLRRVRRGALLRAREPGAARLLRRRARGGHHLRGPVVPVGPDAHHPRGRPRHPPAVGEPGRRPGRAGVRRPEHLHRPAGPHPGARRRLRGGPAAGRPDTGRGRHRPPGRPAAAHPRGRPPPGARGPPGPRHRRAARPRPAGPAPAQPAPRPQGRGLPRAGDRHPRLRRQERLRAGAGRPVRRDRLEPGGHDRRRRARPPAGDRGGHAVGLLDRGQRHRRSRARRQPRHRAAHPAGPRAGRGLPGRAQGALRRHRAGHRRGERAGAGARHPAHEPVEQVRPPGAHHRQQVGAGRRLLHPVRGHGRRLRGHPRPPQDPRVRAGALAQRAGGGDPAGGAGQAAVGGAAAGPARHRFAAALRDPRPGPGPLHRGRRQRRADHRRGVRPRGGRARGADGGRRRVQAPPGPARAEGHRPLLRQGPPPADHQPLPRLHRPRPLSVRWLRAVVVDARPLRHRDFRLLYLGQTVTFAGSMITYVAIPYQVFRLTRSAPAVGLLSLAELVPLLLTALAGGALADAVDRRRMVQATEAGLTLASAGLAANALLAHPRLWVLYLGAALIAGLDGLQRPSLEALVPRLVPREELPGAAALDSVRGTAGMLAGPALGGLLIAGAGLPVAYTVDMATFAVSLAALGLLRAVPPPPGAERPSLRGVADGLRYARSRAELLGSYVVDIVAMVFGMPIALFPAIAARSGGAGTLGLLYAAPAAGALLVSTASGWMGRVHRHGAAILLAAAAWGAAVVGFGLAGPLWLALPLLAAAGGADMVSGMFRTTLWNQTIPDALRGRLASIEMLSYSIGPLLGNVEAGLVAGAFGVPASVVSGGLLCVAGVAVVGLALPAFRAYDARRHGHAPPVPMP